MAEAAGVDLEGRAALDERPQDRLVELRLLREPLREDVRVEVALDDVDVADGVEQPGPGGRLDLVEGGRDDLGQGPARRPSPRRSPAWYGDRTRSWTEPIVKS